MTAAAIGRRRRLRMFVLAATVAGLLVASGQVQQATADGVRRWAGPSRYDTSAVISRANFGRGVDTVYLASGRDFADGLAGAAVAGMTDSPLLLTDPGWLPDPIAAELERLRPGRIVILGGTVAVSGAVASELTRFAPTVERLWGGNRYETATAISRRNWSPGVTTVYVASGQDFPDALSAAAAAGMTDSPLLLTAADRLPDAVRSEVVRLDPLQVIIVGGPSAVSSGVAAQLDSVVPTVHRLSGQSRYHTAATVSRARHSPPRSDTVLVASGATYADALSGAAVAGMTDRPLLLVAPDHVPPVVATELDRLDADDIVVLGGAVAVAPKVVVDLLHHVDLPPFQSTVTTVTADRLGASWRAGCPVPPSQLRLLTMSHIGFDGHVRQGELIVHVGVASQAAAIFEELYDARFAVRRMRTVDHYGGDDDASMADDNTSAFNCREVTGGGGWSNHSYGRAIDINPVENPYVRGATVLPPAGRGYVDRDQDWLGMIHDGDAVTTAFAARGWGWGGDYRTFKDYQHFELD